MNSTELATRFVADGGLIGNNSSPKGSNRSRFSSGPAKEANQLSPETKLHVADRHNVIKRPGLREIGEETTNEWKQVDRVESEIELD